MENNPFVDTIETINKASDTVDKATKTTEEDNKENTNPGYILYNAIANNSIEILSNPEVVNTFKKIAESVGEEVSKSLVEMLAIIITQASYQSLIFYDSMLKNELTEQFNHFAQHINSAKADVEAHHGVLKVFKQQLGEIENALQIKKFESKNNISAEPANH